LTERLYYSDSYLTSFDAHILDARPDEARCQVFLDRTAFYPASGGQPSDTGRIAGAAVVDVIDGEDRIVHVVDAPLEPGPAACQVDWTRRFDHMQQHTGQHLLSAVLVELFGYATASFHLGAEVSTIDIEAPQLTAAQIEAAEARANAVVFENREVGVRFCSPEEAQSLGLRKPSERSGAIRVVEIAGCDRSACGGTHVGRTGEIGPILVRRQDRVRAATRVEFLCGGRAVRQARADYQGLSRVAQLFSAPLDQAADLAAAQIEAAKAAGKALAKLEAQAAEYRGRELYHAATPDARGRRVHRASEASGPIEPWRLVAQGFANSGPGAVFLLAADTPPAILVALAPDCPADAGQLVRAAATALGGRGGGSARLAQASLPSPDAARQAIEQVAAALG